MTSPDLEKLLKESVARFAALSPLERAIESMMQKRSYVLGEMGMDHPETPIETYEAIVDALPEFALLAGYRAAERDLITARERIAELEAASNRENVWPVWAAEIYETLKPYCPDLGPDDVDLPSALAEWIEGTEAAHAGHTARFVARADVAERRVAEMRDVMRRIRNVAIAEASFYDPPDPAIDTLRKIEALASMGEKDVT